MYCEVMSSCPLESKSGGTSAVTEEALQADLTGFKQQQKDDALALVLAGQVEPVPGLNGTYKVASSKGGWWQCNRWGCGCPARTPCYHMCAVRLYEARELMRKAA